MRRTSPDGARRPSGRRVGPPSPQRDRILEAARSLFAQRGYHAVSIDDIGDAVGMTGPSIYRHVGGKLDLLVAVFDFVIENLLAKATIVCAEDRPAEEILARLIELHIEFVTASPDYIRVYYQEENALSEPELRSHRAKAGQYMELWHTQLERFDPALSLEQRRVAALGAVAVINFVGARAWRAHPTHEMLRQIATAALYSQRPEAQSAAHAIAESAGAELSAS